MNLLLYFQYLADTKIGHPESSLSERHLHVQTALHQAKSSCAIQQQ